jgi:hypothetical protein
MKLINKCAVLATILGGMCREAPGIELQRATLDAWQEYVRAADARMQARRQSKDTPFLWIGELPERMRSVQRGGILVQAIPEHGITSVPGGLIHHWIGAVYIPDTTIAGLLSITGDYDRYSEIYRPLVMQSRLLNSDGIHEEFSMIWQRRVLFVNAAVQGHYNAYNCAVDSHHGYGIVDADRIQEIDNYGLSHERVLPPDTGNGFIWRIHSITRYQENEGGVYLEIEAIALTRDIPASLRWLVSPVVNRLSTKSLTTTLSQTRDAVQLRQARLRQPTDRKVRAEAPLRTSPAALRFSPQSHIAAPDVIGSK